MKGFLKVTFVSLLAVTIMFTSLPAASADLLLTKPLKYGSSGSNVKEAQTMLKTLGYFHARVTGRYLSITRSSVKAFQRSKGLKVDGILGKATASALNRAYNIKVGRGTSTASRGGDRTAIAGATQSSKYGEYLDWWTSVQYLFPRGTVATVTDLWTGKTFRVERTYGTNHADCEPLTAQDTAIMKSIWGGQWSWARRPVIVEVNGHRIAASAAGMPHAGLDNEPANVVVNNRSEGYGTGINLDTIKGNNFDGHFDIHFRNSRTHGTNRVDPAHQACVREAAGL